MSMKLDLFVRLKYESSTIISFVGIRYSIRDLTDEKSSHNIGFYYDLMMISDSGF